MQGRPMRKNTMSESLEERLIKYQKKLQEIAQKMQQISEDETMSSDLKIELMSKLLDEVKNDQQK